MLDSPRVQRGSIQRMESKFLFATCGFVWDFMLNDDQGATIVNVEYSDELHTEQICFIGHTFCGRFGVKLELYFLYEGRNSISGIRLILHSLICSYLVCLLGA